MVDEADLELQVLEFRGKSFSFDRLIDWDGTELVVFHRTETESESRFRPRILRLTAVLPKSWLMLDLVHERIAIAPNGHFAPPAPAGSALEAAAETSRFEEQGVAWRREPWGDGGFLYVPAEWADRLLTADGRRRLDRP